MTGLGGPFDRFFHTCSQRRRQSALISTYFTSPNQASPSKPLHTLLYIATMILELQQAADLNNEGVQLLLEENEIMASIWTFHRALGSLQDGVVGPDNARTLLARECPAMPQQESTPLSSPPVTGPTTALSSVASLLSSSCGGTIHSQCSNGCFLPPFLQQCQAKPPTMPGVAMMADMDEQHFVYDRPFLIASNLIDAIGLASTCSPDLYALGEVIGWHVLFNCALAWQLHARVTGLTASMQQAAHLYEALLHMLNSRGRDQRYASSATALTCLILNNRAQLHHEHCEYQESSLCMDIVLSILHETNGLEHYLHERELARLVWNVVHIQPPTMAGAA
jgi:hypothetical protein